MARQFAVARYTEDGELDGSFHSDGKVLTDFFSTDHEGANAVVVDSQDRIVVAGGAETGGRSQFALARYRVNGNRDTSFHRDGKVLTNFETDSEHAESVAIDTEDRIVVAGTADTGQPGATRFAVARYTEEGHLDGSFHPEGQVLTDFITGTGERGNAVGTDWRDNVYVAGSTRIDGRAQFALVRYGENGWHDPWFDWDGKVLTDLLSSSDEHGTALLVGWNGAIIVGGTANLDEAGRQFAVASYEYSGSLRTSFGDDGTAITDFSSAVTEELADMALIDHGEFSFDEGFVAAGTAQMPDGSRRIAVARFNFGGALDESFDRDGKVLTPLPSVNQLTVTGTAVDRCGRTVVVGSAGAQGSQRFFVVRYNPDGSLDGTFADDGVAITDFFSSPNERATDVAIDSRSRPVVVGVADV